MGLRDLIRFKEKAELSQEIFWLWKVAVLVPSRTYALRLATYLVVRWQQYQFENWNLDPNEIERIGIHRSSAYRALEDLRECGLVEIIRQNGRAPNVKIIWE